jgi:hypothetical protein
MTSHKKPISDPPYPDPKSKPVTQNPINPKKRQHYSIGTDFGLEERNEFEKCGNPNRGKFNVNISFCAEK